AAGHRDVAALAVEAAAAALVARRQRVVLPVVVEGAVGHRDVAAFGVDAATASAHDRRAARLIVAGPAVPEDHGYSPAVAPAPAPRLLLCHVPADGAAVEIQLAGADWDAGFPDADAATPPVLLGRVALHGVVLDDAVAQRQMDREARRADAAAVAADRPVLDGQAREAHGVLAEDVEHPVQPAAVDGGGGRPVAGDGQVVGDVEVAGGGGVLTRPGDGQRVGAGRHDDRVGPRVGVGGLDHLPQRAGDAVGSGRDGEAR